MIGSFFRGILLASACISAATAQQPGGATKAAPFAAAKKKSPAPKNVEITPAARDDQIGRRLQSILDATGWFEGPRVRVRDGVVFVSGMAEDQNSKTWATDLCRNTQDVVAVVNKMEVRRASVWDITPAVNSLREIWVGFLQSLPFLVIGFLVLLATLLVARHVRGGTERLLRRRVSVPMLRDLIARAAAIVVVIIGLYLVLKVSGTTQLALTVLGGTGLFGLVLGIAFRDITENFLASIFLSMQRPFQIGDLVEIVGFTGYVNRLTVRTTVIVELDGNYVQIPNATVYKSTIRNFTNNPKRRDAFTLGIAYGKSISQAQDTALHVLNQHPAVLKQPEPLVLVDGLGAATVDVKVYYWVDCIQNDFLAVRSSVIRLVMHALGEAGLINIAVPGEMVFPRGIEVRLARDGVPGRQRADGSAGADSRGERPPLTTQAEARLDSQRAQISEQAEQARPVDAGPNLLRETAELPHD